jgi:hypothetical protein
VLYLSVPNYPNQQISKSTDQRVGESANQGIAVADSPAR